MTGDLINIHLPYHDRHDINESNCIRTQCDAHLVCICTAHLTSVCILLHAYTTADEFIRSTQIINHISPMYSILSQKDNTEQKYLRIYTQMNTGAFFQSTQWVIIYTVQNKANSNFYNL